LKAGIAHFWFPFDDGNGRIDRAITDMQLSKADGNAQRFFSMSAQIQKKRSEYYETLEKVQKGTSNITVWLRWFLECLTEALLNTGYNIRKSIIKSKILGKAPSKSAQ
jgi:Fic family protein